MGKREATVSLEHGIGPQRSLCEAQAPQRQSHRAFEDCAITLRSRKWPIGYRNLHDLVRGIVDGPYAWPRLSLAEVFLMGGGGDGAGDQSGSVIVQREPYGKGRA